MMGLLLNIVNANPKDQPELIDNELDDSSTYDIFANKETTVKFRGKIYPIKKGHNQFPKEFALWLMHKYREGSPYGTTSLGLIVSDEPMDLKDDPFAQMTKKQMTAFAVENQIEGFDTKANVASMRKQLRSWAATQGGE